MTKEMGYNVGGGCGSTIIFGLTKDGDLYADLGGDVYDNEDMLATFAKDCERTLDGIRNDLNKLEDDEDGDDDDDDDLDDGDLDDEDLDDEDLDDEDLDDEDLDDEDLDDEDLDEEDLDEDEDEDDTDRE